mgnify:CR=1 FL=1
MLAVHVMPAAVFAGKPEKVYLIICILLHYG